MRTFVMICALLVACSIPDKQPLTDAGTDSPLPVDAPGEIPETTIVEAPGEFSRFGAAVFKFTSNIATATFECTLDDEPPAACTSPHTRDLADGTHSFSVRATNGGANGDDSPAEHVWMIDTVAPDTKLLMAPPVTDNSVLVRFEFTSPESSVTYDCSLDGGSYLPCVSGAQFGPVSDGAHSFAVRAQDRAGNLDSSPAIHVWAVDTTMPDTELVSGPSGAVGSTNATFTFVSPDAGGGATFACALDGAAYTACTSPHSISNLSEGEHTFAVRVRDAVGNVDPTPATRTWTVDLVAPDTMINSGPSGTVRLATASFAFSSTEPNVTFACSLDGSSFATCTSPFTASSLGQGAHTFSVRAIDMANHADPSPATRTWTVDTVAPDIVITSGPGEGTTSGPRVKFTFTVSEGAAECSLDGAAFAACTSPLELNSPAGGRALRVRATDPAGNVSVETRAWTVACAAPDTMGAAALFHFEDNAQILVNAVTAGTNATLGTDDTVETADPAFTAGRFGSGLAFTSSEGDHVAWPATLGVLTELTVELWARPNAPSGARDLAVTADGRVGLRVTAASPTTVRYSLSVITGNGQTRVVTSAAVTAGAWHHVIVSVREPLLRMWVNGVRTEASINIGTPPALDAVRFGGSGGTAYDGLLDEVWVAQTAIADDEAALVRYCPL